MRTPRVACGLLAIVLLASGCGPTRRHQLAVTSQVVASSLFAVQDAEEALFAAQRITPAQHKSFNQKLVPALELGRAFNQAVRGWDPGTPVPDQLVKLKAAMLALAGELSLGYPADVQAQLLALINATYDAIVAVLLAGGQ
jgi:hypothetical protein